MRQEHDHGCGGWPERADHGGAARPGHPAGRRHQRQEPYERVQVHQSHAKDGRSVSRRPPPSASCHRHPPAQEGDHETRRRDRVHPVVLGPPRHSRHRDGEQTREDGRPGIDGPPHEYDEHADSDGHGDERRDPRPPWVGGDRRPRLHQQVVGPRSRIRRCDVRQQRIPVEPRPGDRDQVLVVAIAGISIPEAVDRQGDEAQADWQNARRTAPHGYRPASADHAQILWIGQIVDAASGALLRPRVPGDGDPAVPGR